MIKRLVKFFHLFDMFASEDEQEEYYSFTSKNVKAELPRLPGQWINLYFDEPESVSGSSRRK